MAAHILVGSCHRHIRGAAPLMLRTQRLRKSGPDRQASERISHALSAFAERASAGPCRALSWQDTRSQSRRRCCPGQCMTIAHCALRPRREAAVAEQGTAQLVTELFDHLAVTMADAGGEPRWTLQGPTSMPTRNQTSRHARAICWTPGATCPTRPKRARPREGEEEAPVRLNAPVADSSLT